MCDHVSTNPTDFATKDLDPFRPVSPISLYIYLTIFYFLTGTRRLLQAFNLLWSCLYASVHNDSQKIAEIRMDSQKTFSGRNSRIPFRTCSVPVQDIPDSVQTSLQT